VTSPPLALLNSIWFYLTASSLALAGLILLALALFAGRARGRRRCPRCWYDMSGSHAAFPITCPECGRTIASERELHHTRRRWRLAILAFPLIAPILAQVGYLHGLDIWYGVLPKWKSAETLRSGATVATRWVIRDPRERGQRAVILARDRPILEIEDYDITFGQRDWSLPAESTAHKLGATDDLNNDGTPDLVVFAYSGGAHCCYTVTIIELSDPPRIIATIDAQNGMAIKPATADPARAGQYDFDIPEQSFDYWNAPHVASPMPAVYYRLIDHHLSIDLAEMLKPAPQQETLDAEAARIRAAMAAPSSELEPDLWRIMLDLIYTGHEPASQPFFEAAWPPDRPGKDHFFNDFRAVLEKSPHYQNLTAALHASGSPASPTPLPAAALPAPSPPEHP
jgi:hypothetical protein